MFSLLITPTYMCVVINHWLEQLLCNLFRLWITCFYFLSIWITEGWICEGVLCSYNIIIYYLLIQFITLLIGFDKPTIGLLNTFVRMDVITKWKDLGIQLLGSSHSKQLNVIKLNNPNSVEECCTKMFEYWLDVDPTATWDKLIAALQHIGLNTLSQKVKINLLKCMYVLYTMAPPL